MTDVLVPIAEKFGIRTLDAEPLLVKKEKLVIEEGSNVLSEWAWRISIIEIPLVVTLTPFNATVTETSPFEEIPFVIISKMFPRRLPEITVAKYEADELVEAESAPCLKEAVGSDKDAIVELVDTELTSPLNSEGIKNKGVRMLSEFVGIDERTNPTMLLVG